ncbi:substrate-binding domain-containing protein, partial [Kitasatospora indigofera]|uniref:substrate-binding domain-containing protein n=1 Tax=Kitasatospora indigofera TaxID=67307 RepID=UPI0036BF2DA2
RIGHIGGVLELDVDFHLPSNRRVGYESALRDAGLAVDPDLFRPADFTIQGGYQAAKQLLGSPHGRPSAIYAASDEMAIGAILAAKDLGLSVPRDVSIIGIDDHDLAEFFGLSTVAQFPRAQGEKAVQMLMEELHPERHDPVQSSIALPFELVVRSSTATPSGE